MSITICLPALGYFFIDVYCYNIAGFSVVSFLIEDYFWGLVYVLTGFDYLAV